MLTYNDVYEILRKEKFSENLQQLPKNFLIEFSEYLEDKRNSDVADEGLFSDSSVKSKKQLENSIAIFKELMLRRKKKLLNLVFVAAETGIMKRDYENMLQFEREVFDKLVRAFEEGDKDLSKMLTGRKQTEIRDKKRMIIFNENVDQFVDMSGSLLGPYNLGQLANLDLEVSKIFVDSGKARYVDAE